MQYNSITSPEARGVKAKPSYTYQRIIEGYKEWLSIIGYSKGTTKTFPQKTSRFLFQLKKEGITDLGHVTEQAIHHYYENLKNTPSKFTGKLLTPSGLNGYIQNLHLFNRYLQETDQGSLPVNLKREKTTQPEVEVLTSEEIHLLYHACSEGIAGLRERAILSLYYGCGLRCNEGISLNLNDILLDKQMVHVRKSKTGRARYVPFVEGQKKDFELYLQCYRSKIARAGEQAFLVGNTGCRIGSKRLLDTLKKLISNTQHEALQDRKIGMHTLRHSIATHLLQSGMEIDSIAQFLGHQWICSTQIYLHLAHEY